MRIREAVVVEGRDDTDAVKRAVDAVTIETHGFGIRAETWTLLEKAYNSEGLIIFTDPDHSGREIRRKLKDRFPDAKEAFLSRDDATKDDDVGVENASPEAIREALSKVCVTAADREPVFCPADMDRYGLSGTEGAAERRGLLGKALGIGTGNGAAFMKKLNDFGITREDVEKALGEI